MKTYRIGFDLGGTKLSVCVYNAKTNQVELVKQVATGSTPEGIYKDIELLYRRAMAEIGRKTHTVGLGMPGGITRLTYLLEGTDPLVELTRRLDHELVIENDANCFALAEAQLGAGKGHDSVFGMTLGTGVGGGLVLNGELFRGSNNLAGEWGHTCLYPLGHPATRRCWCGQSGCVEAHVSGRALEDHYESATGLKLPATTIIDENTLFSHEYIEDFGLATANLINVLDPQCIVIGGGVSKSRELFTQGLEQVERHIFGHQLRTKIVPSHLGDDAGVIGAALLGV